MLFWHFFPLCNCIILFLITAYIVSSSAYLYADNWILAELRYADDFWSSDICGQLTYADNWKDMRMIWKWKMKKNLLKKMTVKKTEIFFSLGENLVQVEKKSRQRKIQSLNICGDKIILVIFFRLNFFKVNLFLVQIILILN